MATNIKDLTKEKRQELVHELSEKLTANTFTKTKEKEDAMKLLKMLSKHEASDEHIETKLITPLFTLKF